MYKLLGEAVDMTCFILILAGTLFAFSYQWSDSYQLNYAEQMVETFFDEAERKQCITRNEYEALLYKIDEVNEKYEVAVTLKRGEESLYQNDFIHYFDTEEKVALEAGDFLIVCISKGSVKRVVLNTMIRW